MHSKTTKVQILRSTVPVALLGLCLAAGCAPFSLIRGPESCSVLENYTDPFGENESGNIFYFDNDFRGVGLVRTRSGVVLRTLWAVNGANDARVQQGATVRVALGGSQTMTLVSPEGGEPVAGANRYAGVFTQWAVDFPLSPEELSTLADQPVLAGRTAAGALELAVDLSPDTQNRLQTLAICLDGNFGSAQAHRTDPPRP